MSFKTINFENYFIREFFFHLTFLNIFRLRFKKNLDLFKIKYIQHY